jgi:tetratricopeptide (TPR) repeat protein
VTAPSWSARLSQIEEALALLDEALQIVERTRERWFAAELNRHKGQLLLRQGHSDAAEELYRKALSIAEEQGAKLWELRAAANLARLWRDQGKRAEAHKLLAPVYCWFTEGLGTPVLKDPAPVAGATVSLRDQTTTFQLLKAYRTDDPTSLTASRRRRSPRR